ncbi:MAG TPA: CHASE4 domain-containing protein [Anaerolineae bacterium]|nr:CHASE4 domain-containing protein [Anaerolineae bacterium]
MTLRLKTLLLVSAALVGLIVAAYLTVSLVLQAGFADVEAENTRQNVRRALEGLSQKIAGLDKSARDYAGWDDTYAFIEDRNQDYVDTNLSDETFANNELSLMMFVNLGGEVVFAKAYDLHGEVEVPIPPGLLDQLPALGRLTRHESVDSGLAGVLLLSDGPLLVASRPILTSEYEGPIHGALIMGRNLDTALVHELAAITRMDLTLARLDDPQLPQDIQRAVSVLSGTEQIHVEALSEESIAGYTLLSDISGQPRLVLRVATPRPVYQQGQRSLQAILLSITGLGLVFVVLVLLLLERSVLHRLARLRDVVQRLGQGGVSPTHQALEGSHELAQLSRREPADEIGTLTRVLNHMSGQLLDLIASLETRIQARTAQLLASADVGHAAASILDTDRLLREVVTSISSRFGFYFTAVFTLDQAGKYAVLREATGEAGRTLKERGHKLEVGGESMVGYVTAQGNPRVALDAAKEPLHFANPLLPDTRSEIALPLVVGDRVLGALDVQSTQEAAFDEASVAVLQSMADQVAVAIANAQSFETIQRALDTTTRLYEAGRALFAAMMDGDAYEAARRAWTSASMPDLDRLGIFMISQRDETDSPVEYWAAAEWDPRSGSPLLPSATGEGPGVRAGARYRPDEMPLTRLVTGDAVLVVRDADDPRLPAPARLAMQQAGVKAALVIPLLIRGRLEGLVIGTARQPIDLREDDVRFMQAVAEQLSVVLGALRAKEETQAALARVEHLNRHLVGEAWRSYLALRPGGLAVESGDSPRPSSATGEGPGVRGVSEEASRLAIPIVVRGRTLGALALEDDDPARQWSDEEWDLLTTVAGEVAQMLENARLLEQTQLRAARESQLNEIARKIRRTDDIDLILKIAAEELGQALDASHARAMLGAPADLLGSPDGHDPPSV